MKQLIFELPGALEREPELCLGILLSTRGSTPQVPGAAALFSREGLLVGTLGGGAMEGDATARAKKALEEGRSFTYGFELNAGIHDSDGAICGGAATLLLDTRPSRSGEVFATALKDLEEGRGGILATRISGKKDGSVAWTWIRQGSSPPAGWDIPLDALENCGDKEEAMHVELSPEEHYLLQHLAPREELIICGAGHIGKALSRLGRRLDFRVRVIDSREEYARKPLLPDAHQVEAVNPGEALKNTKLHARSYVVIVTRGHQDDGSALKACIGSRAAYIGMIGSRKKIRTMREEFLQQGWASPTQFDRVHAPIGLEIGAETVEEIALSIAAELVQARRRKAQRSQVWGLVLAAGSSSRMGQPKMLLPFGDKRIIETVTAACGNSMLEGCTVVLGAHEEQIRPLLDPSRLHIAFNRDHESGMLSSIQCGVRSLPEQAEGMLLVLGDQPLVDAPTIDRMVQVFRRSFKHLYIATYGGKRGHPVLISRNYFKKILELPPEQSLRDLLAAHPEDVEEVPCDNPGILVDIDTPEEYKDQLSNLKEKA